MSIRRPLLLLITGAAVSICCGCGNYSEEPSSSTVLRDLPPIPVTQAEQAMESLRQNVPDPGVSGVSEVKVSASHILIPYKMALNSSADVTRTKEEAFKLAQEIAVKAKGLSTNFGNLAREYSEGPSASVGGDLGNFFPSTMAKSFRDATLALEIGEVSDPVETQYGIHIIRRKELTSRKTRIPGVPNKVTLPEGADFSQ
ncbi:MAG: peptidyl-prolyl cis-trans isomerase [Fuerstiella sp.]|nr:peptidyl-prolyl cis-trans isomerase [Fuerstiella sp.]